MREREGAKEVLGANKPKDEVSKLAMTKLKVEAKLSSNRESADLRGPVQQT